jgi:DNA mismatch endonuclease (patch repair protein)
MTTSEERSRIMRAVRSKDTGPELMVRRLLCAQGVRYRLHRKDLPGNPDIVVGKKRKAIFVHGCFWHGHRCRRGNRVPKTNTDYWVSKVERNKERDRRTRRELNNDGWEVLTIWECELKDPTRVGARVARLLSKVK